MTKPPPQPPMFNMSPPFPNMSGAKIKVTNATGSAIGDLICKKDKEKTLFGVRIDTVKPPVFDHSSESTRVGEWTTIGHIPCECLFLSEALIRAIKASDSTDYQFTLDLDTNIQSIHTFRH